LRDGALPAAFVPPLVDSERALFAERALRVRRRSEANRALAKMSLKEEDCVPDTEGALQRTATARRGATHQERVCAAASHSTV
jgi:hypothetical protein